MPPTKLLNFRVTRQQEKRMRRQAEKQGITISEYIRRQCDPDIVPAKAIPKDSVALQALTLHIYSTEGLPMEEARREAARRLEPR